jgi:hypothetical protein
MGVDYSVTLGVGKYFRNKHEAEEFLAQNLPLTEEQLEEMDDFGAFSYGAIEVECMNGYSGEHWFVGVHLHQDGDAKFFADDVVKSIQQWNEVFPNDSAEVICEVKVY